MLRVRRFEERCVELYSAGKIRGFLHLYIGEEAVAVGAHAAPARRRRGLRHLPRARPRAGARRPDAQGDGRDVRQGRRLLARSRRVDAPVRRRAPPVRRQRRSWRPGCRRRWAWRSPTRCSDATGHRLLLRRGRDGRGRVPRVDEPGGAVEAADAVPVREQPLRDGYRAGALGVGDQPGAQGGRVRGAGVERRRHGRARGERGGAARRRAGAREQVAGLPRGADLPLPGPLDVRPRPLPRQGGDRAVAAP